MRTVIFFITLLLVMGVMGGIELDLIPTGKGLLFSLGLCLVLFYTLPKGVEH